MPVVLVSYIVQDSKKYCSSEEACSRVKSNTQSCAICQGSHYGIWNIVKYLKVYNYNFDSTYICGE